VLVVDDEVGMLAICERALVAVGCHVESVRDGASAVARIGEGFDVIVSDIQMPAIGGMELLRRIRERDLDVPVVLMTGAPTLDSALQAIKYGALRYLTKPIDPKELVEIVRDAARLRQLARAKREALELLGAEARLVGDRAGLHATFERALASLWMAYQPIVSPPDRRVFGYEGLLRSSEPTLPHPGAVLDAAERLGRTDDLGRAVRDHVARTVDGAPEGSTFFVNLHARDLLDGRLFARGAALSQVASRVVLEITERATLDEVGDVRERIRALRELGFRLAVDDLGAGYAGLTSFAAIEPDVVKLDMSLVRGIDASPVKHKIVDRMTALAHDLKILVVAEGVETPAEREVLVKLGCDLLQGYLFAKPGKPFPEAKWEQA
jgi:EAL domain-containing protein (putative c-di-GMP-specific phosphodiesterase class I)